LQPKAELLFLSGERTGQVFPLEQGRTVIGRQVGDLIVNDKEVSSIHAIISYERGGGYGMDLGSTNGVFVDEQVKLEARLRNGTELRVGQSRLRFHVAGAEEEDSSGPPDLLADSSNADLTLPHAPRGGTLTGRQAAEIRAQVDRDGTNTGPQLAAVTTPASGPSASIDDFDDAARKELMSGLTDTPQVQVALEVLEGADKGAIRRFTQESILIGRLNTDLVVRDSDVSRRHSIIEVFDASQVYLRDLNSTNGSFVNGRRVSSVRLRNGDQIRLGRCLLRFSARPVGGAGAGASAGASAGSAAKA
jgi:pSer/pThr/pTyr-binding forkhead associated (FHA) protein